jgi:N-acetylglutamate synthase-like GNAT family acetyltransferase
MNLTFRKAQLTDVATIVALVNSAYRGESSQVGWTTEADFLDGQRTDALEISSLIETTGSMILLCLQENMLVGSVHLEQVAEGAYLGMLSIQPRLQGTGVGKQLMATAEQLVQEEEDESLWYQDINQILKAD